MKTIVIEEKDWTSSKYKTVEWEKTVTIKNWEHDYVKQKYTIKYEEK